MMAAGRAALDRDRHGAAWRETSAYRREAERVLSEAEAYAYRERCAEAGVRFTELNDRSEAERDRVRANHCSQARVGYYYCRSTRDDPCGAGPGDWHPHAGCSESECSAPREAVPAHDITAVAVTRSVCGAGAELFYLYTSAASARPVGCLREMPAAGRSYRVPGTYTRKPADVTMVPGFTVTRM
jgi:hypothetical protein